MSTSSLTDLSVFCAKLENLTENTQQHLHDHIEIFKVKSGFVRLYLNSTLSTYDVFTGDCALICSNDNHALYPSAETSIETVSVPLSFITLLSNSFLRSSFIIPHSAFEENISYGELVDALLKHLICESEENSTASDAVVKSLCASLCSVLFHLYSKRRTVTTISEIYFKIKDKSLVSSETLEKFSKVSDYISHNYTDSRINLSMLSKKSGLNKNFLSSLFPKIIGKHYTEYIHELRINHAIELMYQSDRNISEIAFLCGFETVQSFYNTFKKLCNVTPSVFLSDIRGKGNAIGKTVVYGKGSKLFNYGWYTNKKNGIFTENNTSQQEIKVLCTNIYSQLWCHLMLKLSFFAGESYKISYKGKTLNNSVGKPVPSAPVFCCFTFKDNITNNPYHPAKHTSILTLEDGWSQYETQYTVPDYYVPSLIDCFSLYSSPLEGLGVSFLIKDVLVEKL